MAAIIQKIRAGNQFEYVWAIERAGVAVDLTTATDIELSYGVGKLCADYSKIPFTVVDGNKISSSHLYGVTGTYNLKLEFKIDGEQSTIDIDAFKIVPRSEDASESSQFAVTSDMAIGFKGEKGEKLIFADLTPSDIAELQKPANDAIVSIQAVELSVEQAEALRVQAEIDRQTNTGTAIQNAETAIQNAQTATTNAQTATTNANNAATLANTKAGLADTAATNANTKAGLADTAATNANNVANTYAAELALKEVKSNKQNSLATDGTGTKFPTVDAVNGNFASQAEAEANTDNAKFMTALRVFQNFVKNATTYAFSALNTTSKTITGAINELFANKANKVQEEWIEPTLLNGWTHTANTAMFIKDEFGFIHCKGSITGGAVGSTIFTFPAGYIPVYAKYFVCNSDGYRISYLWINYLGELKLNAGDTTGLSLDAIYFKVNS